MKILTHDGAGNFREEQTASAGGAPNAGKVISLDQTGRLTMDMMPTGIGSDSAVIEASEALSAGDFVNIHNSTGAKVRKADGSATGKAAHGFVLAAVASGGDATVYFEGLNDQLASLTPGEVFLSAAAAGQATNTAPSTAGQVVQLLGVAISETAINVELARPILLA